MILLASLAAGGLALAAALGGWAWWQRSRPSAEVWFFAAGGCLMIGIGCSFLIFAYMNIMRQGGL